MKIKTTLVTSLFISNFCIINSAYASFKMQSIPLPMAKTLSTLSNGTKIIQGGFGSGASSDPTNIKRFFALTDRGPNAKKGKDKVFPTPNYTPTIGLFEIQKQSIKLIKLIPLQRPDGTFTTGLPNPQGYGATGEKALDLKGNTLTTDKYGIDSEGLVAAKDGTFYVSDEYGPHIVHYDKNGLELERISPSNLKNSGRHIPAVFSHRRPNRGMEGLTLTPDQSTLVGIMQSTLYNPDKQTIINKTLTRIITFNVKTGTTKQYLYRQNHDFLSNSEILAIGQDQFIVIERDGKFAQKGEKVQKHIYLISFKGATDISDPNHVASGLIVNGKTLEQNTWKELAQAGIVPVNKKLMIDMVKEVNYPHEKMEGLWIAGKNMIGVLNDDDFSITSNPKTGEISAKILPQTKKIDHNTLYLVPLPKK